LNVNILQGQSLYIRKAGYTALSKRRPKWLQLAKCNVAVCGHCAVEPLRVEPPVADLAHDSAMDGYCLQQGVGVTFAFLFSAKGMTATQSGAMSRRA
jgi:hypothetical protein